MIKLNNKNITYVALADSNNSVKGVKEIWYADSNNSVKLVYRRKDALIEGVDYEKYHWLVSTGAEWIDTAVILDTNMGIYTIFAPLETNVFEHGIFGASSEPNDHNVLQIQRTDVGLYIPSGIRVAYANVILNAVQDWSINLANDAKVYLNGAYVADTCPSSSSTIPYPIAIFSRNRDGQVSQSNCSIIKMNKFTIVKNSIPIITLIPCKLLKPVPKWLDANGIRRQVGECGMIDLVSGKFYGNVNSVGTFTVENYYERKEWLRVQLDTRGSAMSIPIHSRYVSFNRVWKVPNNSSYFYSISGSDVYNYYADGMSSCVWYDNGNTRVFKGKNYSSGDVINIRTNQDSVIINDEEITWYGTDVHTINFALSSSSGECDFLTSSITVNDKERYIPCTLTMDLPASMDANNIARTKGTSGMWDLVSDKFYGNVASSGTFKAVNLAEGVDYEVHQWLIANIPIGAYMLSLPVNSSSFEFKCKFFTPSNCGYFSTEGYAYYKDSGAEAMKIWSASGTYGWASQTTVSDGDLIEIISSTSGTTINGESVPQKNFPITNIRINQAANATRQAIKHISSITIDGIERYIPVKLLRSIPSKYDANGIARQAGECGMYDTVNDVFYGNVASSGTFSVSDDS